MTILSQRTRQHQHSLRELAIASAATVLVASVSRAATLPSGFEEVAITGAISNGTAMEFSPDGKLYVLEQAGTMEVYQGSGGNAWVQVAPSNNFFTGNPLVVNPSGERGLLGIAFDPGFASNRFLYVYYTATLPAIHNRISRFTANAAGTQVVAGTEVVIMDLENLSASNHNGGAMHFGPDGKLYVAVGENANGANSQSINNRLGKILRLNPDPINPIPADNPTSIAGITGTPSGLNRAIWCAGLRNPYTFAFRPGTSVMYINDVGGGSWEEINIGAAGANYGWSLTEGPFNQASFPNFTHAIAYYPHSASNQSVPPLAGFTGFAITGGAFYLPSTVTFPADYVGDYFLADYVSDWIKRYDPVNITVQNFASGAGSPVDLRVGSDGALYYLARDAISGGSGRVFRVQVSCNADVVPPGTGNGTVNIDDLLLVINSWGATGANPADVTGNGVVDIDDLLAVISAWGQCP